MHLFYSLAVFLGCHMPGTRLSFRSSTHTVEKQFILPGIYNLSMHILGKNLCSLYHTIHRLVLKIDLLQLLYSHFAVKTSVTAGLHFIKNPIKRISEYRTPLLTLHNSHQELHAVRSHRQRLHSIKTHPLHVLLKPSKQEYKSSPILISLELYSEDDCL